ncbi:MAG: membrane associated rhomboid family serine protease [Myxococcota bacterium]
MVDVRVGDIHASLSWDEWEDWVRTGRVPPDADVRIDAVTGDDFVRADSLESYADLKSDGAADRRASVLSATPPILTALLVGIQIRIWWFSSFNPVERWITVDGVNFASPVLEDAEGWRLLTMGFLHLDMGHILLNMLWLAYTGSALERTLGRLNLLTLYIASVLGGSLLSMWFKPETSSLGASGGVFGLIAAVVVFGFVRPEMLPKGSRRFFGVAMLPYLVLMFASGLQSANTDNWAHFGGLLVGAVLALVLAPPSSKNRSRNRFIAVATATVSMAIMVGFSVFGPYIERLAPTDRVQSRMPGAVPTQTSGRYEEATWDAPLGWRSSILSSGLAGFNSRSPASDQRGFAVAKTEHSGPITKTELAALFTQRLERTGSAVLTGDSETVSVAGYDATHIRFDVGQRQTHWYGIVRGTQSLEAVWETDGDDGDRLNPLRDRLLDRVVWRLPYALIDAQERVDRNPTSRSARLDLADALAKTGSASDAAPLFESVVIDHPENADAWLRYLTFVEKYPSVGPTPSDLTDRALAAAPSSGLVVEIAKRLKGTGRHSTAIGLLELQWFRSPGNTSIRRALRRYGRSTDLEDTRIIPLWRLANDDGIIDREAQIELPGDEPLTLAEAAAYGDELLELQTAQCTALAPDLPFMDAQVAAEQLLRLKLGFFHPSPEPSDYRSVERAILAAGEGRIPLWMCGELVAAIDDEAPVRAWLAENAVTETPTTP